MIKATHENATVSKFAKWHHPYKTAKMFLTTDVAGNDYLSRTITHFLVGW